MATWVRIGEPYQVSPGRGKRIAVHHQEPCHVGPYLRTARYRQSLTDITNMYAFPSPERPGRLVLVLNTMPHADTKARFSEGLTYRFRLRAVTPAADSPAAAFVVGKDELTIDCTFSPPTVSASRIYPYLAPPRAMPTDGATIADRAAPAA